MGTRQQFFVGVLVGLFCVLGFHGWGNVQASQQMLPVAIAQNGPPTVEGSQAGADSSEILSNLVYG
jgi:hypothetical protein